MGFSASDWIASNSQDSASFPFEFGQRINPLKQFKHPA